VFGAMQEFILMSGTDGPETLRGTRVTDNTFRVLGVPPLIGRPLTPDDGKPGAPSVAVLSHRVWQNKFGADSGIVGRTLVLSGQPTTVVGVMPPRFTWGINQDLWLPATLSRDKPTHQPQPFLVRGHLKPGVSMEQAAADVAVLSKRFALAYPQDHPKEVTFGVESLAEHVAGEFGKTLKILLGAVGLLLLIACVNVAKLLLACATAREKEIAIRVALGASRCRLVRQFLIESLLVALGGAVLGCLLAWNVLGGLLAVIPPDMLPSEAEIRING
jgi:putative ABC transport system permease protein